MQVLGRTLHIVGIIPVSMFLSLKSNPFQLLKLTFFHPFSDFKSQEFHSLWNQTKKSELEKVFSEKNENLLKLNLKLRSTSSEKTRFTEKSSQKTSSFTFLVNFQRRRLKKNQDGSHFGQTLVLFRKRR